MADNYLEKKMEEHRQGGVSSVKRRFTPSGQKPGYACFRIGEPVVFVKGFDAAPSTVASVVRAFRNAGCRVAFTSADIKTGRAFAQSSGARHYPVVKGVEEKITTDYGVANFTVEVEERCLLFCTCGKTVRIQADCDCPSEIFDEKVGEVCLYLSLPYSGCLIGGTVTMLRNGEVRLV